MASRPRLWVKAATRHPHSRFGLETGWEIGYTYVHFGVLHLRIEKGYSMESRISFDPNICHGQACIRGTRIPVHQLIRMLANDDTIEDLLEEYPSIMREDILACFDYAATLAEEQVTPLDMMVGEYP